MTLRFLSLLALSGVSLFGATATPPMPEPAAVLAITERAADWQLSHPDPKLQPTNWIYAAFYTGLMAASEISPSPRFHDAAVKIGEGNHWKLGRLPFHADDHCVGQMYAELYLRDKRPEMIAEMRKGFDYVIANPRDRNLDFDQKKNPTHLERWSWCDALFMAPPAYLRLSAATGDPRYREFAIAGWWATSDYLYDREEHLYYRDSTYFAKREPNGKKVFWSRGNGWVLAGLVRMLEFLPASDPSRGRFEQQYREMAEKILTLQQPDGFWRMSLLDAPDYPAKESSGTGFYCYALAWGVNHGLLVRSRFTPAVLHAWEALVSCVNADGKLTRVQIVAGSPLGFSEDSTMPYGVGAFLLSGSEIYRLAGGAKP